VYVIFLGVLFHEIMFAPDATLSPLLALCNSALEVCIGDFQSTFVPLLLFIIRFAVRVRAFFYHPVCTHRQSTLDLLSRLNTFFNAMAKPLLFKWLAQVLTFVEQFGEHSAVRVKLWEICKLQAAFTLTWR